MKIIALEGPSYAGKTTTITHLRRLLHPLRPLVFDCYVQEIDDPADIPPTRAPDAATLMNAFEVFARIEGSRVNRLLSGDARSDIVILDRSVDTLLAHVHAMDLLFGYTTYPAVRKRLRYRPYLKPDHTLYLDTDFETLRARRRVAGIDDVDYFLHHPGFLAGARAYFLGPLPLARKITVLPGNALAETVAGQVATITASVSG